MPTSNLAASLRPALGEQLANRFCRVVLRQGSWAPPGGRLRLRLRACVARESARANKNGAGVATLQAAEGRQHGKSNSAYQRDVGRVDLGCDHGLMKQCGQLARNGHRSGPYLGEP